MILASLGTGPRVPMLLEVLKRRFHCFTMRSELKYDNCTYDSNVFHFKVRSIADRTHMIIGFRNLNKSSFGSKSASVFS
jgi:hypothetical protein